MSSTSISLVQLNIERDKHFDRIFPFLNKINPEVVCVQELNEQDISLFEKTINAKCFYVPMAYWNYKDPVQVFGLGIFSRLPISSKKVKYYHGSPDNLPTYVNGDQNTLNHVLAYVDVKKNNSVFRIGTTHFTWTPDGKLNDFQYRDFPQFLKVLEEASEIIFTGDFNAPRGGDIFDELARRFTDNVPKKYTTSIDINFHRNPSIKDLMVDGIFSTPGYNVTDVEMVCGLSDHCAIVAKVSKR